MEDMKHSNKITYANWITILIGILTVLISFGISVHIWEHSDLNEYDNHSRILMKQYVDEWCTGKYSKLEYPYLVCNLEGEVLYTDKEFKCEVGDRVNVQELLQKDQSFTKKYPDKDKRYFILKQGESVSGFAVVLLPIEKTGNGRVKEHGLYCMIPAVIGMVLVLIFFGMRLWYCNRRILVPIQQISTSSKKIIRGNYDYEVVRIYENEIASNEVGDLIYSFECMRDELKNKQITEEELKKSQQELISCISHDLKTPLSTIKAYVEGMQDGIATTEEKRAAFIRIILEKTNLMIGMIEDLLQFSNAQLNQLSIVRKEVYFRNYFEKVMKELELYVKQNGLKFVYSCDFDDMIVTIDEQRITEVLYNLVENSIKYSNEDGKIEIYATREEQRVTICVKDNGRGISSDDIPYVFDKFYRAEKSRSSSIPGSGLGLSICKYIIEQHGCEIYCRSRKNKGCEISFTLM